MCGLWGVVSSKTLTKDEKSAAKVLGGLSFMRGVDSTGVLCIGKQKTGRGKKKSTTILSKQRKTLDNPVSFFTQGNSNALVNGPNTTGAVVGP